MSYQASRTEKKRGLEKLKHKKYNQIELKFWRRLRRSISMQNKDALVFIKIQHNIIIHLIQVHLLHHYIYNPPSPLLIPQNPPLHLIVHIILI